MVTRVIPKYYMMELMVYSHHQELIFLRHYNVFTVLQTALASSFSAAPSFLLAIPYICPYMVSYGAYNYYGLERQDSEFVSVSAYRVPVAPYIA